MSHLVVAEVSIIPDDTLLCCLPKNHTIGASVNLSIKAQQTPTHHLHFLSMIYEDTAAHGQDRPETRPKHPAGLLSWLSRHLHSYQQG